MNSATWYRRAWTWFLIPSRMVRWTRERLKSRGDVEHTMSRNRLVFLVALGIDLGFAVPGQERNALIITGIGLVIVITVFLHLLFGPARSLARRVVAMVSDLSTICIVLHLGGESTSCFFPLLLWTVLGNGLRFGRRSLLRAMAVTVTGFAAVIVTTPFWRDHMSLSAGLMLSLIMLPLYALSLLDRLRIAKQQAEAASEAKSMFLASVSHEMRTPLHAIVGLGSLLERSHLPQQAGDMVRTMMDASERMLEYIDDLLSLTKREATQGADRTTEFAVVGMLTSAIAMSRPQAEVKNLSMRLHISPRVPNRVRAGERHIRQVLLNLLSNALKFTQYGGVLVAVDAITGANGRMRLRFEVTDTGIGIAEQSLEKIFEPFVQESPTISEQFGGTGLGLAICKKIAEGLDGDIGAYHDQGGGTTVWFEAPYHRLDAHEHATQGVEHVTVLTINGVLRRELKEKLERFSIEAGFIHGVSSEAALKQAADRGQLILLDWSGTPAWTEATHILRNGTSASWPICILIGDPAEMPGRSNLKWLCDSWVPENFSQEDLGIAVRTAEEARQHYTSGRRQIRPQGAPLSVLVADDNETNQMVVARMLEAGGHSHVMVTDGRAALKAMQKGGFDVVLMDINMPGMNGLEATRLFREIETGEVRLPILGLTADVTEETERRCRAAGMDDRVLKPVATDDLLAILEVATAGRTARHRQEQLPSRSDQIFDEQRLTLLREASGADHDAFLKELMRNFFMEAKNALAGLHEALRAAEWDTAKARAHALASCSASVGATRLRQASLDLERSIPGLRQEEALQQATLLRHHIDAAVEDWSIRSA